MPEGDILHDTAGDCSDKELLTGRLPGRNGTTDYLTHICVTNICQWHKTTYKNFEG